VYVALLWTGDAVRRRQGRDVTPASVPEVGKHKLAAAGHVGRWASKIFH
jgi:hypothetical protein